MNDDLHPHLELASAILDGDARSNEQDVPDVVADLVKVLGTLRAELADVAPPTAAHREQVLAAALAEFDLLATRPVADPSAVPAHREAPGATVLSFFRRRAPVLMGAAAAVVVAGVVTLGVLSTGTSNDESNATQQSTEVTDPAEFSVAADDSGAEGGTGDGTGGGAEEMETADVPPASAIPINGPAVAAYVVNTPEELLGLAAMAVSDGVESNTVSSDGKRATWPGFACSLTSAQVVVADIVWLGTPAFAVLDTATGAVSAVDGGCTVLTRAAP